MAQALPRFCPQCGTPTRANMHLCPTCGLSVEAMLKHSTNTQSASHDFAPQKSVPEAAQPRATSGQGEQEHPVEEWPTQVELNFSPMPPATQEPQNAPSHPIDEWPTQEPPDTPSTPQETQEPQNTLDNSIDEWPTQVTPSVPPTPHLAQESQDEPDKPIEEQPTQVTPSVSPMPHATQEPQEAPDKLPPISGTPPLPTDQAPVQPARLSGPTLAPQPQQRRRMAVVLVLLAILLVLGGGGYLTYSLFGGHFPASQSQIKTTNLNTAINYAGIDITILNVQQAQNFVDDPQTDNNGMIRLNLQEQNQTAASISWSYKTSARLLAPGVRAIAPVYVTSKGHIAPGATQKSLIDFPIANGGNLNKLIFQLGSAIEAQIQVPLTGLTTLNQYQPRTSQQNGTLTYFSLNWTLTSITTSLSIPGQQAPSGMEFLTLTLKVDSTLSQEAITGSPFDYLRVQTGGKTAEPVDTTLPVSFAAGEKGQTGTALFLIPQDSHMCTLIL